ncbi:MAG: NADH-quinone oxidoreductase subunit L [Planctomycetota bacterium]|jgi:NADH-quinone oxidoreductase subunit L|nr:NADH-quinone oxidoreductase subunit L [Planctomycetota bacterium]
MPSLFAWAVPMAPLFGCIVCAVLSFRGDRKIAHFPAILSLLFAAVSSLCLVFFGAQGEAGTTTYEGYRYLHVGGLTLDISLKIDTLCLTLLCVVTCISAMIAIYSKDYMHDDPGYARYFSVFCGFVFCMTMLVLSHNLLMMYAFWEGVGTCSYLLIGFWFRKPSAARAATKAFLVNRIADCGFLFGILLLGYAMGQVAGPASDSFFARLNFDNIFTSLPALASQHPDLLGWISLLLMIGAIGKSAQFPFHVWLPDAMEGPTPVSALIHAATMVTAGVYLMARLSPLMEYTPWVLSVVGWLGGITALIAALMALFQDDLKRVLAYSTVSQLGYLFMALSTGSIKGFMALAVTAAMFHLVTHAFFKALLFLAAGNVMHAMGDVIDMRKFSGLKRVLPKTNLLFLVGAAALAGIPLLSGFFSKDGILAVLYDASSDGEYGFQFKVLLGIGFLTAFMTAVYTSKAYFRTFHGTERIPEEAGHHAHESTNVMLAPMALLAVGALVVGGALGPTHILADYLGKSPTLESHSEHHESLLIMIASGIVGIAGCAVGFMLSKAQPSTRTDGTMATIADFGKNRLYIDWAYSRFIVLPLEFLAGVLGWLDTNLVDAFVMKIADLPRLAGLLGQRYQNGRVPAYTFVTAVGVAAVAIWIVSR